MFFGSSLMCINNSLTFWPNVIYSTFLMHNLPLVGTIVGFEYVIISLHLSFKLSRPAILHNLFNQLINRNAKLVSLLFNHLLKLLCGHFSLGCWGWSRLLFVIFIKIKLHIFILKLLSNFSFWLAGHYLFYKSAHFFDPLV